MSPNINSFVGDLVAMAQAVEELPKVQAELDRAKKTIEEYAQSVQDRELAIFHYKLEIDGLNTKVRSLEVERDDASFRVLEAEDVAASTLTQARDMQASLVTLITRLDPPKPQPEPEKEPEHIAVHRWSDEPQGSSEPDPTQGSVSMTTTQQFSTASSVNNQDTAPTSTSEPRPMPPQDQSASDTTAKAETTSSETASSPSAPSLVADTSDSKEAQGPYVGRLYYDVAGYISRADWLAGGGTDENYDYRR